jgi:DNA-binding response OmpR family regulator
MSRVLVALKNDKSRHFVTHALRERGHAVDACSVGADALRLVEVGAHDVLVVDTTLAGIDGFTLSREVRRRGVEAPVLMLGEARSVKDKLRGFDSGADDFLVVPFAMDELVARVRALLRRSELRGPGGATCAKVVCGELEVNRVERVATLAGQRLRCTSREVAVLAYLAERQDELVTRAELLARVWDSSFEGGSNAIDVHLCHLRAKLGENAWMIETVRGKGYRLRSR